MGEVRSKFINKIGFMQGRLSPLIDNKIQAFPWPYWQEEFALAGKHDFHLMEWTLDQERLYENPLMTKEGRQEILELSKQHGVAIGSLTGDCFMEAPFYKFAGRRREQLFADLGRVIESCATVGISLVVLPLVDNGSLTNQEEEESLLTGCERLVKTLRDAGMHLLFESDFPPAPLAHFIQKLAPGYFGINYDIGNSASLGYRPLEEIAAYGHRILNVHVKDRLRGGGTVPLGKGAADIPATVQALTEKGYRGNYILQTARAADGDHVGVLCRYRDMLSEWLGEAEKIGPGT